MNPHSSDAFTVSISSSHITGHPRSGLTAEQARRRLQIHGENVPEKVHKRHWSLELLSRFKNPLVLILLGAGLVSAVSGELVGFSIIFVIVGLSILMDFLQQVRADLAVERLSATVSVNSTLLRGGKKLSLIHI